MEAINFSYKEKPFKNDPVPKVKKKRSNKDKDESFRFFSRVPLERRKSSRLRNLPIAYTEDDLVDENLTIRRKTFNGFQNDSDYEDIEEVVFRPTKKRKSNDRGRAFKRFIIPVEEVTDEILNRVVKRVSDKIYSDSGTSCHQCRQKTTDQKTCCRHEKCFGVRGQFCGVCLENR